MALFRQCPKFLYSSVVVTTAPSLDPNLKIVLCEQRHPKEMGDASGEAKPWDGHAFPFGMGPLFTPDEHA
ncbi:MAG: hypothetical protein IH977_17215 [Nitrospinae bacterium]|nr:hypothetical protein [Nitrospinota bacterium]